jgi:hypothetical protein
MRDYIEATEGMILTDGVTYGTKIFLAVGIDPDSFHEITEEEYNEITNTEDAATEEDYQNALKEMGVRL